MTYQPTLKDGYLYGLWVRSRNQGRATQGNIHSDESAQQLGFRGGLVAGSIHLEAFMPLVRFAFGDRWFNRGSLSIMFLNPTVDGEEIRAVVGVPGAGDSLQVAAWGERPDGTRIGEGTAAVGEPAELSALTARELIRYEPGELRILANVKQGAAMPVVDTTVTNEQLEQRFTVITEVMDWYKDPSRWGGLVATPVNFVNAMIQPAYAYLAAAAARNAIGLYGAIEMKYVNGPLLVDTTYRAGGTVLAAGQSPKTEYVWFDTWADDAGGRRVAEMRMMLRYMKASSPLYQEAGAGVRTAG